MLVYEAWPLQAHAGACRSLRMLSKMTVWRLQMSIHATEQEGGSGEK